MYDLNEDNIIDMLENYILVKRENHEFTMLENAIEKLLNEYKEVKQDLKLKNDIIVKLAIKGVIKDD